MVQVAYPVVASALVFGCWPSTAQYVRNAHHVSSPQSNHDQFLPANDSTFARQTMDSQSDAHRSTQSREAKKNTSPIGKIGGSLTGGKDASVMTIINHLSPPFFVPGRPTVYPP